MNLSIYGHFGSQNHGNEAIVRGMHELFDREHITLYSFSPNADVQYELNQLCEIKPFLRKYKRFSLAHIFLSLYTRITRSPKMYNAYCLHPFLKAVKGIYLLEGGDQYCENDSVKSFYAYVNKRIVQMGGKTIMLPCTISKEAFIHKSLIADLKRYSLILARESITYNALIEAGMGKSARFAPCPAFLMKARQCILPELFSSRSVVGLTIGLLAQGKERYSSAIYENSRHLIEFIIKTTDYAVALIPHVNVGDNLTDITSLNNLYNEFKDTNRVVQISEKRADELKYVIGNCRFMITLRTHASIAAYSSCVPTIVIGYSQKSIGIATDLFGTHENYVIRADALTNNDELISAFMWLRENENTIKHNLTQVLPRYLQQALETYNEIVTMAGAPIV